MIVIRRRLGLIGEHGCDRLEVAAGPTYRELLQAHAIREWQGLPTVCCRYGRVLRDDELDQEARDGDDLVLAAMPLGIEIGALLLYSLISAAVGAVINLAMRALLPTPKPPGESQQIGDESSPSSSWDGVRTTQGQGLPTATVLGRRGVGGHVIFAEVVSDSINAPGTELTRIVLALSKGGRVDKIGGLTGGVSGEINGLGGFAGGTSGGTVPSGILINGVLLDASNPTPGLRCWLRFGELDQAPLPAPFTGSKVTDTVGAELRNAEDLRVYTVDDDSTMTAIALVVVAPGGIYTQDPGSGQRGIAPVDLEPRWRPQGTTTWQQFVDPFRGPIDRIQFASSAFSGQSYGETWNLALPQEQDGPLEVRLRRVTPSHGSNAVDLVVWRQVTWSSPHVFAYPGVALIGFEIESSELWNRGTPEFLIPVDGLRVRTYAPTLGLSATRSWEVPAAPHDFWLHPVGRNPAWLVVEIATGRWALGRYGWTTAQIDLDAFARWACYCDANPGPGGDPWSEARYCGDLVVDAPRSAWDWIQQLAAAGGAVCFVAGNRLSLAYRYRDAHSCGPITVAAKIASQLLASPLLDGVSARWIDARERPAVIDFQIHDEGHDWNPTPFAVRDPDTSADDVTALRRDNATVEPLEAPAVTRPSQCFRQGWLAHRLNRLATQELVCRVPYVALAAEIGDVVAVQTTVLRPFGAASVPMGATLVSIDVAGTTVSIDRELVLAPATSYVLQARNQDGGIDEAAISSSAGTYAAGAALTLATAIDAYVGAVLVVGIEEQLVLEYEIVAIGLQSDGIRPLTARLWTPDAYDEPGPADFAAASSSPAPEGAPTLGDGDLAQDELDPIVEVDPADIRSDPVHDQRGAWLLSWPQPETVELARVYVRPVGALSWWQLPATRTGRAILDGYRPGDRLEVMISTTHRGGRTVRPGAAGIVTLTLAEFPAEAPPQVHGAEIAAGDGAVVIRWRPVDDEGSRVVIRRGAQPELALELFEGRSDCALDPAATFPRSSLAYWLAVRDRAGMLGAWTNAQDPDLLALSALPEGCTLQAASTANTIATTATRVGLTVETFLGTYGARISDGLLEGTATSPELVLVDGAAAEYEAEAYWSASAGIEGHDQAEIAELDDVEVSSGEALWRSLSWREASLGAPGVSDDTVDGLGALQIVQAEDDGRSVGGLSPGEPGRYAWGELWSRFRVGGVWGSYKLHVDGRRVASRMQLQVRLYRLDLRRLVFCSSLIGSVYA